MKKNNEKRIVESWSIKKLISVFESGKLDLETEYQRDPIWSLEKRQLLIDSILHDIDIPKVYLAYFIDEGRYECIDGKQRINSVLDFYNNKLKIKSGEPFGKLNHSDSSNFLEYEFSISIINNPIEKDISELFLRLNIGTPLNGGEKLKGMTGDMRNFVFKKIGRNGPFIGEVGMEVGKGYRYSREIAIAQMIVNSLNFREANEPSQTRKFLRVRYEDIRDFFMRAENEKFDAPARQKADKFLLRLKQIEKVFGGNIKKLIRKSAIVSAYLYCEEIIEKKDSKNLDKFPKFYIQLLAEMKQQADLAKNYKTPTKKILLEKFQKNLQQASSEGYSIERRHKFLEEAFTYYLKTGKIIGDKK